MEKNDASSMINAPGPLIDIGNVMDISYADNSSEGSVTSSDYGDGPPGLSGSDSRDDDDVDSLPSDEEGTNERANDPPIMAPLSLSGYDPEDLIPPLLALAYKLRHNLSYSATEDALQMAKVLTDVRITHKSKYDWKKISNSLCDFLSIHHVCHQCHNHVGKEGGDNILLCLQCDQSLDMMNNWRSGNVVLYMNVKDQLQYFLEMNHTKIINPQNREKQNKYALEDIFDGSMYKKIVSDDLITLNFNIDGTPVHKSSLMSLYPILCTINELPPKERGKNMILSSLWFGAGKAENVNEFMKPFVMEVQDLQTHGFEYKYQGKAYHKKCQLVVGICDSIARPLVRNSSQFNHEYGCGLCLHPGLQVPKGNGTVKVYPIDDDGNPFGEGLRNHEDTAAHSVNEEKGIRGRSILYDVPGFDIIDGLVPDWMRLATLGVAKQFCKLWLDSQYYSRPFFLGRQKNVINCILESFTPTSILEISRTTRRIDDRKFWKAHEWSIWLLFYSLPILRQIAPRKFVDHWAWLVDGISILLITSIMRSEVEYARQRAKMGISLYSQCFPL